MEFGLHWRFERGIERLEYTQLHGLARLSYYTELLALHYLRDPHILKIMTHC